MKRYIAIFVWLAAGLVSIAADIPAAESPLHLRLIPFPKQVQSLEGQFALGQSLVLEAPAPQMEMLARLLNDELRRAGLTPVKARAIDLGTPAFRLAARPGPLTLNVQPRQDNPEAYGLEVRRGEVVCRAPQPAGLFYGLQTLCQLIRANRRGDSLPGLQVNDWPSLRWRCFQDDMTRGPSSTLATLKFEAGLGASLKFNLMTFYMEYQYAFKKHPKIGPPNGSLTPDDLAALVAFVKPLHLDILGNQQSFGHYGQILKHPEYAGLREVPDVLTPVKEETYQLLDDLYSEVCPLLPFPWFNVCCDETWGLGTGPSKELAGQIGVGGVYVRHIRRIHDLLGQKYGKRMMMWGDIILQHPDKLGDLPKDTIMLTWGYDARPSFEDQIIPFARSGYEFFVCPGVSDWSRILPDFGVAITNIQHFVRDGVKHGAIGMLNTDWQDDGEALKAVKWHADAWAAECAWNGAATPPDLFNRRVGAVLFGEKQDHFGQAVELLTKTHRLPGMDGMMNSRFWKNDFAPQSSLASIPVSASNLLAVVRPALGHLEACQREAVLNQPVLEAFLVGARRMERIGQRKLDGLQAAQLYAEACASPANDAATDKTRAGLLTQVEQLVRTNREAHAELGRQFAALWLSESKPYALDWTTNRYQGMVAWYDDLLRKLAQARAAVEAQQPLPPPEALGLALPGALARSARPSEIRQTPLAPEAPWAEPSATHRIGLTVRAGSRDRFELPVEVEVKLPEPLISKPVRAFQLLASGGTRELLAQVDSARPSGSGRLVLLLPGPIAKDTEAVLHVYLGLKTASQPLPQAVTTANATNDMMWLENDQVRLLLGSEGSHIYRWEVKGAGHRDLTMPGETNWAGFADIGTYRNEPYRLECVAWGPALVRYQCAGPSGDFKTISLYGGVTWMDVMLGEPTPLYWDFDDPRNFAADGPTPGTFLFSNGQTGSVGREADGVSAQVKTQDVYWGIKFNADKLAVGLATPETAAFHHIAPGAGAGGAGIESSPLASHFVTFAGRLNTTPADTMNRLCQTLNLKNPPAVIVHEIQAR